MFSYCLVFALATAQAPPDIEVPTPKPGKVGRYVGLKAETKGTVVLWKALDPGLDFLDPIFAPSDSRITGVIADAPGKYRLLAITSVDNKPALAEVTVTFEGKEPPPPPKPPTPPPGPVDPLIAKLQLAFTADQFPLQTKQGQKIMLTGLYDAMAEHAKKPTVTTTGQLLEDMKKVAGQLISPGGLMDCRKLVAAEIALALGTDPTAKLDPVLRPKAVEVFTRITKALAEVK